MNSKKLILIIMDGWGEGQHNKADAIFNARTPFVKSLYNNPQVACAHLQASGLSVGLPDGQMGNSEVGHLNLGAGRVVFQELVRINNAVENGEINNNPVLTEAFRYARQNNKKTHFIGLVSNGGVHSMTAHLEKLCEMTAQHQLKDVFIHVVTDGRDTDPYSGKDFIAGLIKNTEKTPARIASLCGRYYTMDRDKRWERIKFAYDLLVHGTGEKFENVLDAISSSYSWGITDEFIKPAVMTGKDMKPLATIEPGDVVVCFNFRTDRLREITTVLTQRDIPDFQMKTMPLYYVTMTRYDESFKNVHVVFDNHDIQNTLGEVLQQHNKKQLRIAETEKYPHVTFFFSGGREEPFTGEERFLIQSPKVATYDLKPSMSAYELTDAVVNEINTGKFDFICLNFANSDMVGHTGVYTAITEAVETVDKCVKKVVDTALANGYSVILTADHGNSDFAINDDGTPNTAHTCNPVPCFLFDRDYKTIKNGSLSDIAPTILQILNLPLPAEMSGKSLLTP